MAFAAHPDRRRAQARPKRRMRQRRRRVAEKPAQGNGMTDGPLRPSEAFWRLLAPARGAAPPSPAPECPRRPGEVRAEQGLCGIRGPGGRLGPRDEGRPAVSARGREVGDHPEMRMYGRWREPWVTRASNGAAPPLRGRGESVGGFGRRRFRHERARGRQRPREASRRRPRRCRFAGGDGEEVQGGLAQEVQSLEGAIRAFHFPVMRTTPVQERAKRRVLMRRRPRAGSSMTSSSPAERMTMK